MKQVRLDEYTDKLLTEIAEKRKENHNLVKSKQGIISHLVMQAHRKECKK
jgi:hypothetical protein